MVTYRRKGFTLIELLIVVAIIGILAAIAIPNFLEAQVRAKVARVKGDFHTFAVALESYCVDNNDYPVALDDSCWWIGAYQEARLYVLTTPIEYLASLPYLDPFDLGATAMYGQYAYEYKDYASMYRCGDGVGVSIMKRELDDAAWFISSRGPDTSYGYTWAWPSITTWEEACNAYDATNGTMSWGDIYAGSSSKAGKICPEGSPLLLW